jgi:chlorite dismutase
VERVVEEMRFTEARATTPRQANVRLFSLVTFF